MAARKQVDISCMFCGNSPCTCMTKEKKQPTRTAPPVPRQRTVIEDPPVTATSAPKRASLVSLARAQAESNKAGEESEREALTALFKAGFILEPVGDPRGFAAVRERLNLTDTEIDIVLWKERRRQWQHSLQKR